MPSARYYYADQQNQPVGPFGLDDLERMLSRDILSPDTQVCQEDGSDWLPLSSLLPSASRAIPRTAQVSAPKKKKRSFIDTSFEGNVKRPLVKVVTALVAIGIAFLGLKILSAVFDFDPDQLRGQQKRGIMLGLGIVAYFLLRVGHSFVNGFREGSAVNRDHEE